MTVHKKLNEARVKFHALPLKKSGRNTFAKYSYFELSDFLVPALQICNEVGISCTISFCDNIATMRVVDVEDGSTIIFTTPIADATIKGQLPIQSLGSLHTYIRRYLWMLVFEVVESDAIDATIGQTPVSATMEDADAALIIQLLKATQTNAGTMAKHYGVDNLNALNADQAKDAIKRLQAKLKTKADK